MGRYTVTFADDDSITFEANSLEALSFCTLLEWAEEYFDEDFNSLGTDGTDIWVNRNGEKDIIATIIDIKEEDTEMKMWYAVLQDADDNDWGTGSFCLSEAFCMARRYGPNAYIAVIEDGENPVCVEEIHDIPEEPDFEDMPLNDWTDGQLMTWIDDQVEFDGDAMTELCKRANHYDQSSDIFKRWSGEPDGKHDIQSFYDEACEIIREYHKHLGV